MRQTAKPRTAGERQGSPVRFDLAVQRGAEFAKAILPVRKRIYRLLYFLIPLAKVEVSSKQ